jgi:hypothetical protein
VTLVVVCVGAAVELLLACAEAAVASAAGLAAALDAWADFSASCLAFASDTPTAPRAFSIARVSPATPGAEPVYGVVAAEEPPAGAAGCAAGGVELAELGELEPE